MWELTSTKSPTLNSEICLAIFLGALAERRRDRFWPELIRPKYAASKQKTIPLRTQMPVCCQSTQEEYSFPINSQERRGCLNLFVSLNMPDASMHATMFSSRTGDENCGEDTEIGCAQGIGWRVDSLLSRTEWCLRRVSHSSYVYAQKNHSVLRSRGNASASAEQKVSQCTISYYSGIHKSIFRPCSVKVWMSDISRFKDTF
jgi:hypothetical protein